MTPREYRALPIDGGKEFVEGWFYQYHPTKVFIIIGKEHPADLCTSLSHIRGDFIEVLPETVGQYIGIKDKGDVKIWEGDIARSVWQVDHKTKIVGQVRYYSVYALHSFMNSYGDMVSPCWNECEVIGNIHDDPQLLEVQA